MSKAPLNPNSSHSCSALSVMSMFIDIPGALDPDRLVLPQREAGEWTAAEGWRHHEIAAELEVRELDGSRRHVRAAAGRAHAQLQPLISDTDAEPGIERLTRGEVVMNVHAEADVAGRAAEAHLTAHGILVVVDEAERVLKERAHVDVRIDPVAEVEPERKHRADVVTEVVVRRVPGGPPLAAERDAEPRRPRTRSRRRSGGAAEQMQRFRRTQQSPRTRAPTGFFPWGPPRGTRL